MLPKKDGQMVKASPITISKLDAARRQLETAVTLYFHEGDPVSIHALTRAAYQVLYDINDGQPMIEDWIKVYIKPEYVKQITDKLRKAQNFFKHADRDPDAILPFEPQITPIHLLVACLTYNRIAPEPSPHLTIFQHWAVITWAKTYFIYPGLDLTDPDIALLASMSRQEFLAHCSHSNSSDAVIHVEPR